MTGMWVPVDREQKTSNDSSSKDKETEQAVERMLQENQSKLDRSVGVLEVLKWQMAGRMKL